MLLISEIVKIYATDMVSSIHGLLWMLTYGEIELRISMSVTKLVKHFRVSTSLSLVGQTFATSSTVLIASIMSIIVSGVSDSEMLPTLSSISNIRKKNTKNSSLVSSRRWWSHCPNLRPSLLEKEDDPIFPFSMKGWHPQDDGVVSGENSFLLDIVTSDTTRRWIWSSSLSRKRKRSRNDSIGQTMKHRFRK